MLYYYSNNQQLPELGAITPFEGSTESFAFRAMSEESHALMTDKTGSLDLLKAPTSTGIPQAYCVLIYSFFDETGYGRVLGTLNDRTKDIAGFYPILCGSTPGDGFRFSLRFPTVLLPEYIRAALSGMDRDESSHKDEAPPLKTEAVRQVVGRKLPSVFFDLAGPSNIVRNSLTVRGLANMTAQALNQYFNRPIIKTLDFEVVLSINERLAKAASALIAGTNLSKAIVAQMNVTTNTQRGLPIDRLHEIRRIEIAAIPEDAVDSAARSTAIRSNEAILTQMTTLFLEEADSDIDNTEQGNAE